MSASHLFLHAYFAGGCFWCLEAVFRKITGVRDVTAGYAGGNTGRPSYEEVSAGTTGHAETVKIDFDPASVTYGELLEVFFRAHDPTTRNRQGADHGTQYRSVVFYADETQKREAAEAIRRAAASLARPTVTELKPLGEFHAAEEYHQRYFEKNPDQGYCALVIGPKLSKLGLG